GPGPANPDGEALFIEIHISGTVGGTALALTAVDRLLLTDGMVISRCSFMDPLPMIGEIIRQTRTWRPWWRSGVGPALWRRRLTR
ncbi:MAG TPA: hypothetical protein VHN80_27480, partial [Kineosporiaceae bacterium]|nr:hypothetical protein [Kineosporiaceae bacterium]